MKQIIKKRQLTHNHHKLILTLVILVTLIFGIIFALKTYGSEYTSHTIDIVSISLIFVITVVLIIMASVLVKIEDDIYHHNFLLEEHHREHKK